MSTMLLKKTGYNTIPFMKFKYVYIYLRNLYMWLSLGVEISTKIFSSLCLWYFLIFYGEYTETQDFCNQKK